MFSRSACLTLCDSMDCSLLGSCLHGDSPHKNTGVSCHAHLQGIFPTQGSNPGLLHHRLILYCLSHQGSPNRSNTDHKFILENSNNTLISEALLRNLLIKHLSQYLPCVFCSRSRLLSSISFSGIPSIPYISNSMSVLPGIAFGTASIVSLCT